MQIKFRSLFFFYQINNFANNKFTCNEIDKIFVLFCFRTIQINTQGILTFGTELNGFLNVPFPLEYASIAPFYSNIDTTNASPETSISFSTLSTERNTRLAYETIRRNFALNENFRINNVLVATWENVGHYRENNTEQNTFQVRN